MFVVSVPGFRVNRFTDRDKDTQTTEIKVLHVPSAKSARKANDSMSRIELGKLVLLDGLPVVIWCGFDSKMVDHGGADSICEQMYRDGIALLNIKSFQGI
jgi:hypothetical protein